MEIIGHEKERDSLERRIGQKKMAQSYLFSGPSGIGKRLVALEFAARLVGQGDFISTPGVPHPVDVRLIEPETVIKKGVMKEKKIPAEVIREGMAFLSTYPSSGQFRVLLIDQAELLSETAANALLKTLEEPNPTSVIILISSEEGRLLPTLLSRVEKIHFSFVAESRLEEVFGREFSASDAAFSQFLSSLGRPGLLIRARAEEVFLTEIRETLGTLFRLSGSSLRERLFLAEKMAADVPTATRVLEWWLPGLHSIALKRAGATGRARLFWYLEDVESTLQELKNTQANPRLLLEKLFLKLS